MRCASDPFRLAFAVGCYWNLGTVSTAPFMIIASHILSMTRTYQDMLTRTNMAFEHHMSYHMSSCSLAMLTKIVTNARASFHYLLCPLLDTSSCCYKLCWKPRP